MRKIPSCTILGTLCSDFNLSCNCVLTEYNRLCKQARFRRAQAFRPGTSKNHISMMSKYINFCQQHDVSYYNPTTQTLCAYTESLAQTFRSAKSVTNYLSAVRLLHKYAGKQAPNLDSFELGLMVRASKLTMRDIPNTRKPVSLSMLNDMCKLLMNRGPQADVMRLAIQLAFFGFLRSSNLAPSAHQHFDKTRHLTRGDVIVAEPGLRVKLKWSKTLQTALQPRIIPIVQVNNEPLDVVLTFNSITRQIPAAEHAPLFLLPGGKTITVRQIRSTFKALLRATGYSTHHYSLHSLRRGGATECYQAGAHYIDLKRQGAWSSSAFWSYVARPLPQKSSVCQALRKAANKITK